MLTGELTISFPKGNISLLSTMQTVEKNIEKALEELNTLFEHQHQLSITVEPLDVLAGFKALTSE